MTNSDRLQEIREQIQKERHRYSSHPTMLLLGSDVDDLLQLVTEQQNEISWLRTWIFRLHDPEVAAQKIHQLTEEPMTIDQIKEFLGIDPGSAFGTPGTAD